MVHKRFTVAEVELSYTPNFKVSSRPKINSSFDAYEIFIQQWHSGRIQLLEEFKILLMSRRNRVLGIVNISKGGISGTIADPKVIFVAALKSCASALILCHNHTTGELKPSVEDIAMTRKLKAAGKLLDIEILDHLIISEDQYFSFTDKGIL
ncbi:JAB domain-containing protein [Pedobacter sp. AW31-3R]|uniref:JAB domain-containing protein n=1 Tax=Pedobacter sp. AW31-3R TaxID=3445781 RepID=UPI003FA14A1E